jgi:diguanylate cyclase (GGDEF)-like protein
MATSVAGRRANLGNSPIKILRLPVRLETSRFQAAGPSLLRLQNTILEMVAKGEPLAATTDRLCLEVEKLLPGIVCSVITVDRSGLIHPLSGPSLPGHYSATLDGLIIGPNAGSCGSAAYLRMPVAVTDIATDPRWHDYRALALPLGVKACWSSPICDGHGDVVGTFAFYYRENRGPTEMERDIVSTCVHLCAIALEREERVQERERRASVDMLTGLANRASFDIALSRLSCSVPGAWALLVLDLDNLKFVNDTFGHAAGDHLLQSAGARVTAAASPDRTFRLGGDEFAVLVQSPERLQDLGAAAALLLAALSEPADCGGHIVVPKATIGGAMLSARDRRAETVRKNADHALYHAKETCKGGFALYGPQIGTAIKHRLRAIQRVDGALRDDRIEAFYQPIVDLKTGEIAGVEALCRLRTPAGEIIPASSFHEATSDANVASQLTERMMMAVAADTRAWLDMGIHLQHVAINVSSTDFHANRLDSLLAASFEQENVPLSHVVVEVTEAVYMGQQDHAVARQIKALRDKGLRIALDDFGTGFASLTHLVTVPVDLIKIDRSFVDRLNLDSSSAIVVEALLWIARNLGIGVVAEGVETEQQRSRLRDLGCVFGQGFLFSKPLDRAGLTALLRGASHKPPRGATPNPTAVTAG